MAPTLRRLGRWKGPWPRQVGAFAFLTFLGLVAFSAFIVPPALHSQTVFAAPAHAKNEPWLEINCLQTVVEEGDDFRLLVNKKFESDWPHPTMRVFWYTDPITADPTDYEHLYGERQASNGYQSEHGRMGRDFHTLEDDYPEMDETFKVRFNNSVDHGHDGECIITITDDDGTGIYDLEITSTPNIYPASGDQGPQVGYAAGDVIEITAHFTGDVTTVNPNNGQQSDYAGVYIQVGENRRFAPYLRNYGADALIFGYTVTPDDLDTNGISVEGGGPGTGLGYSPSHRDGGIWITDTGSSRINRLFHGLNDDPEHRVFQIEIDEPTIIEPEPPANPVPHMTPFEQEIIARTSTVVFYQEQHGELTTDDEGRDWFSFEANAGDNYIIELKNRSYVVETGPGGTGWSFQYVPGHLLDPSILEIVDAEGDQVLGERDQGGFVANFARAFFTPDEDGTYYVAVGAGEELRDGLGHYTMSVRADDHADDHHPNPDVAPIRPGGSITATIDSDVAPDDTGLNPWDWWETSHGNAVPIRGDESPDDRDVFRLEITQAGPYKVSVINGPDSVGVWSITNESGSGWTDNLDGPTESFEDHFLPGIYLVEIGTPYRSEGNTGRYTVTLEAVGE